MTQMLMSIALVAVLIVFSQSEKLGDRFSMIESLSFDRDGHQLAVSKLMARDAGVPLKRYLADVSRTISTVETNNGNRASVIRQDFKPGSVGYGRQQWYRGRQSTLINPGSGKIMTTSFDDDDFIVLDIEKPKSSKLAQNHPANYLAVSASGKYAASSGEYGLSIHDTESGETVLRTSTGSMSFLCGTVLAFANDESRVLIATDDSISFVDVVTGKRSQFYAANGGLSNQGLMLNMVALGPENTIVVCDSAWVRKYDFEGKLIDSLQEDGGCSLCDSSKGGNRLATIGNHVLKIYDMHPKAELLQEIEVPGSTAVAISPDGSFVAVGDSEGLVTLYEATSGKALWVKDPPGRRVGFAWPVSAGFILVWLVVAWVLFARSRNFRHRVVSRDA